MRIPLKIPVPTPIIANLLIAMSIPLFAQVPQPKVEKAEVGGDVSRLAEVFKKKYPSVRRFSNKYADTMSALAEKEGVSIEVLAEALVEAAEWMHTNPSKCIILQGQAHPESVARLPGKKNPEHFKRFFLFTTITNYRAAAMSAFIVHSESVPLDFVEANWSRTSNKTDAFEALTKKYANLRTTKVDEAKAIKAFLEKKHYYSPEVSGYGKDTRRASWLAWTYLDHKKMASYADRELLLATKEIEAAGGKVLKFPFKKNQIPGLKVLYGKQGAVSLDDWKNQEYPALVPVNSSPSFRPLCYGESCLTDSLLAYVENGYGALPEKEEYKKAASALRLLSMCKDDRILPLAKKIFSASYHDNDIRFAAAGMIINQSSRPVLELKSRLSVFVPADRTKLLLELFGRRFQSLEETRIVKTSHETYRNELLDLADIGYGASWWEPFTVNEVSREDAISLDTVLKKYPVYRLSTKRLTQLYGLVKLGSEKHSLCRKILVGEGYGTAEKIAALARRHNR